MDITRPWDSLSAEEQRLFARMAEVYAGFLAHADHQIGRLLDYLEVSVNENKMINGIPDDLAENLAKIDPWAQRASLRRRSRSALVRSATSAPRTAWSFWSTRKGAWSPWPLDVRPAVFRSAERSRAARRPTEHPTRESHSEMTVGPMMVSTREAVVGSRVKA